MSTFSVSSHDGSTASLTLGNEQPHQTRAEMILRQSSLQASSSKSGDSHRTAHPIDTHSTRASLAPVASGGISTFGTILTPHYGSSSLNPANMTNNCVSVSMAKLLAYRNVYELWLDTYGFPLPDHPMSIDQVVDLVQRTGWSFRWEEYQIHPHLSVNECLRDADTIGLGHGCATAILYFRPNGTGHCVVRGVLEAYIPLCYQHDDEGDDVEEDIKTNAKTLTLLRLKSPLGTKIHRDWLERYFLRRMEKRAAEKNWSLEYRIYMNIHKSQRTMAFDEFCQTLASLHTGQQCQNEDQGISENSSWDGNSQQPQAMEAMDGAQRDLVIRAKL